MAKRSRNLSLDTEAIRRGERYGELHGTNVSQLVSRFLAALPLAGEEAEPPVTPAVRRLVGVAAGGSELEDHRRYLEEKHER